VQNTTHVTQETNQDYGMLKSDVRRSIHILTSDLVRNFNQRQALFDLSMENIRPPPKTVSIGDDHYGIILLGRAAYSTRGISALPPAFYNVFSNTKKLRACALFGKMPLSRAALNYRSIHGEVARDATIDLFSSFRYQYDGMLEVESQNHKACIMLTLIGYKGDTFERCTRRRVKCLSARVSTQSSEEE
jgi:hypothetical protein